MVVDERQPGKGGARPWEWWVALFLGMVAMAVRCLPWHNFLGRDGGYLFYGPDSYDHLRRITLGVAAFPRIPLFDSYYGYPVGTGQIWSPCSTTSSLSWP